jgi:iron complex transport system permease protein
VVISLRLSRTALAILAGASLAVAGAVLQAVLRNVLATPYTLGVSAGAGVTAGAVILFGIGISGYWACLAGTGGALAATLLVTTLAGRGSREGSTLILAGVTINVLGASLLLLMEYLSPASRLMEIVRWMMGDLAAAGYSRVFYLLPFTVAGTAMVLLRTGTLNQMLAGEELAETRGVNTRRERAVMLTASAILAGGTVGAVGPVGFVGLVVPHVLRRITGGDCRRLVPLSALGGAVLLVWSDIVSRIVVSPGELPVGIITALIGGPYFLHLLRSGPDHY